MVRYLSGSLVLAVAVLGLAHFVTLMVWARPWIRPVLVQKKVEPVPLPKGSIKWKSPKAETQAARF